MKKFATTIFAFGMLLGAVATTSFAQDKGSTDTTTQQPKKKKGKKKSTDTKTDTTTPPSK